MRRCKHGNSSLLVEWFCLWYSLFRQYQQGDQSRGEEFMDTEDRSKVEETEMTEEELQEFMASYKKELAHIYKMASAKKAFMARQQLPNLKEALKECDQEMREDIEELKHKYGIHY